MRILGLSAFYHESACCLLAGGELIAAAAEERFSRRKHDSGLPVAAMRHCLESGGIDLMQLDALAYYEQPIDKLARQLWAGVPRDDGDLAWLDPRRAERAIRERLGWEGPLLSFPHHASHAASAFFYSGFEEAALLTSDGVGEWATATYGHGKGTQLELFEEVQFPHSLGLLYSTLTAFLGFRVNGGEFKVMGLAPYGEPRFVDQICQLIGVGAEGQLALHLRYFDFLRGPRMWSDELPQLLGIAARPAEGPLEQVHQDIAHSLQLVVEEILLEKAGYLAQRTGSKKLALAGGVALNAVAIGRIAREGPFDEVFVQPAAGDSGACLGAAALAQIKLTGERPLKRQQHTFLGPRYSNGEIARLLTSCEIAAEDFSHRNDELLAEVARRLDQRQIVGWFHGAMEHGPRALGGRSILANPLDPGARQRLNASVKRRESFRPFAPSVLAEAAADHFELDRPAPFMLQTCQVRSPLELPAITHVDGSARPHTVDRRVSPRFAALIDAFARRTGCPMLVNTSFNLRGEPIVATPQDALLTATAGGLDALILEDFLIDGRALPKIWHELQPAWDRRRPHALGSGADGLGGQLYPFV